MELKQKQYTSISPFIKQLYVVNDNNNNDDDDEDDDDGDDSDASAKFFSRRKKPPKPKPEQIPYVTYLAHSNFETHTPEHKVSRRRRKIMEKKDKRVERII